MMLPCPCCGKPPRGHWIVSAQYQDYVVDCCDSVDVLAQDDEASARADWLRASKECASGLRATGQPVHENYETYERKMESENAG